MSARICITLNTNLELTICILLTIKIDAQVHILNVSYSAAEVNTFLGWIVPQ